MKINKIEQKFGNLEKFLLHNDKIRTLTTTKHLSIIFSLLRLMVGSISMINIVYLIRVSIKDHRLHSRISRETLDSN